MRRCYFLATIVFASMLAGSCAPATREERPSQHATQPPVPAVVRLGELRMARVRAAYGAVDEAVRDWGLQAFGQNCLLLFDESSRWLLGCPGVPPGVGFVPTGEEWNGGAIRWKAQPLGHDEIFVSEEDLEKHPVAFSTSYRPEGGGDVPILVIREWDSLHKSHPGFLTSPEEEWLAIFVHESFHARQLRQPRVREVTRKLPPSQDELVAFYKSDEAYRRALGEEYAVLANALDDPKLDVRVACDALADWLSRRELRRQHFVSALDRTMPGRHAWDLEALEMFIEGTARYVEARFLIAGKDVALQRDATFHGFVASRGNRPTQIPGLSGIDSLYFYTLGMELSFLLDVAEPEWKRHVFDTDGLLIDQLGRSVKVCGR